LIKYLTENKIGTRLVFAGNLTKQPYMKKINYKIHGDLPNTDFVMENTFWVGVFPGLSDIHMNYIADKLKNFFYK
jgi:CDP-6-deoxy-D-xylo-4-hexulose-3-dehydrase